MFRYVKIYLIPGSKNKKNKRKTSVKKNTSNPIFEETFRVIVLNKIKINIKIYTLILILIKYTISKNEINLHELWISVWHHDPFGSNKFLGEVYLKLDNQIVSENSINKWYQLDDKK